MKRKTELLTYIIIFETGILISLLGVILLHGMSDNSLSNKSAGQNSNSGKGNLVLLDTESGEEIAFPDFQVNTDGNWSKQQGVCMKNREGRILYLGEYDDNRGILTGDLLLTEEELDSFLIVNWQNGRIHALSLHLTEIQTGDYSLFFSAYPEEIREGRVQRFRMTVFYTPI